VSRQYGDASTSEQTGKHTDHQRTIVLKVSVHRANGLQCVETGE
jgi:hypothetical protein